MVRKIILILVSFLLSVLAISFLSPRNAHAACTVSVTPVSVPKNYNGNIELNSDTECFGKKINKIEYWIIALPKNKLIKDIIKVVGSSTYSPVTDKASSEDGKKIIARLNFNDESSFGNSSFKYKPHDIGPWTILVCLSKMLSDCDDQSKIAAQGSITVEAEATPVPPSDLPKIIAAYPLKCKFVVGAEVTLTATNIQPNTSYQWWWNKQLSFFGHGGTTFAGVSDTNGSDLTFVIPPSETGKAEVRDVCIEDKDKPRTKGQSQNCISLEFFPGEPKGDTYCTARNAGTTLSDLYEEKHPVPSPPCAKYDEVEKGKCIEVQTAIGNISAEPEGFVKSIFTLVLGLAGGIALILIIIAGYRFMASQGDPEKITEARQQLVSAIVGLLFIIFSFVILQVIGVDILRIPGFGE